MEKEAFDKEDVCQTNKKYAPNSKIKTVYPIISDEKSFIKLLKDIPKINSINQDPTYAEEIVDEKLNLDVYRFLYEHSVATTLKYMYKEFSNGIYVYIKNNKVDKFLPFYNLDFRNNWHDMIKLEDKYNSTKDYFAEKNKIYPINQNDISLLDKSKWSATDCLLFTEESKGTPYLNDAYWVELKNMIDETCKNRTVPDVIFFINKKDLPFLKKNRTHPFESIVGNNHKLNTDDYYYFSPILSQSTRDGYADIPIPSADEWQSITKKYFLNKCSNSYLNYDSVEWENKINTAFFRGRGTGCDTDILKNPRLHITKLNNDWKENPYYNDLNKIDGIPFLDAGIISFTRKSKAVDGVVKYQNPKELEENGVKLVDFVDHEAQSKYKYLLYIEGNSAAYRLAWMLNTNSLVLMVESKYKLWFEHLLIPYEHYVPIKHDLSDLAITIQWCKSNDEICKKISENAIEFCKTYLTEKNVYDYMQNLFIKIANKQFSSDEIYKKYNIYKKDRPVMERSNLNITWNETNVKKTALIIPFRDNGDQNRTNHLVKFIDFWKSKIDMLNGNEIKIFIAEQSHDNMKFNRGQLCNLGFKLADKEGFENIIVHDVDLIPSDNLLPYYFYISEYPLHLGKVNPKYDFFTYFGGVTGFSKQLFLKFNGFPNQLWGWGGEDDITYNRCTNIADVTTMYIPNKGSYDEFYHQDNSNTDSSMGSLIKKKLILDDLENGGKDGLSNLKLPDELKINKVNDFTVKCEFTLKIEV